ncbi:unnamed protein product [Closterium sp. NIES-54]
MVAKASSSNNLIRCPVVLQVAIFVTLLSLYYKLFSDPFPQSWPLLGPSDAVTIKTSVVTTSMVTTQMVTASTPAASPGAVPDASLGSNNNSSFPNPVAVRDTSSSTAIPSISTAAPSSSSIPDSSICSQAVLQDSKTTTTTSTPQVLVVSPEDFISTIDTNPKDSPQSHAKPDPIPPTAADLPVSPLPSLLTIPGSRFTSANQLLSFQTRLACLSANATWQLDPTPRTLPWSHAVSAGWECDDRWRSGPGQNNSRYKNVAFKEADDIALAGGSAEEWKVRNTVKYKWVPEGRCGEWGDVDKGKLAEKLEGLTVFIVGDSINAMLFKSLRNHFRQASTPGSVQQGEQQNSRKAEGESLELVEFTPAFCKSRTKNRLLQQRPYLLLCTGVTLGNTKFIYVRDDVMSTDLHLYVKFPKRISVPWLDVIVKGEAVRERQRKDQEKRREEEKKRRQQERRMQQLEGWQEQKEQLQMKWLEQQKRRKVQERHGKQVQEERHDERQGGKGEEEEKRIGQWRLFGWPFSETPQASANKVPVTSGKRREYTYWQYLQRHFRKLAASPKDDPFPPISVLVLNRGAHWVETPLFIAELNHTLTTVRAAAPNLLIIYRSAATGHTNCTRDSVPSIGILDPSEMLYHWGDFTKQNEEARKLVEDVGGVFMDIVPMTVGRPDGHQEPPRDCLHYCLPGPPDEWLKLLYHVLLDLL